MDELKKLLSALLSSTLKMDETAVAALLNADGSPKPEALKTILDADAARVAALSTDNGKQFDNGYKKGQLDVMTNFETEVKNRLKVTSDKKGIELIDEIIQGVKESGKKKEITPDDVMQHPVYKDLQTKLETDLNNTKKELTDKLTAQEQTQKKKETFERVKAYAKSKLDAKKPLLSQDAAKAQNQLAWFFSDLEGYDWEEKADGTFTPMKDKKAVLNPQGYTRTLDDLVDATSDKYYDFQVASPRDTPPGKDPGAGAGAGTKVDLMKPTTRQHYLDQVKGIRGNNLLSAEEKQKHLIELDKMNDEAKKVYEGGTV